MDSWDGAEDHEANARLIAAAPELLEALEKAQTALAEWRDGTDINLEEVKYLVVDEAIRKARQA